MALAEADVKPVPNVTIVKPMGSKAAGAMAQPAIAVSTTRPDKVDENTLLTLECTNNVKTRGISTQIGEIGIQIDNGERL